jgi:hypothetical protein
MPASSVRTRAKHASLPLPWPAGFSLVRVSDFVLTLGRSPAAEAGFRSGAAPLLVHCLTRATGSSWRATGTSARSSSATRVRCPRSTSAAVEGAGQVPAKCRPSVSCLLRLRAARCCSRVASACPRESNAHLSYRRAQLSYPRAACRTQVSAAAPENSSSRGASSPAATAGSSSCRTTPNAKLPLQLGSGRLRHVRSGLAGPQTRRRHQPGPVEPAAPSIRIRAPAPLRVCSRRGLDLRDLPVAFEERTRGGGT